MLSPPYNIDIKYGNTTKNGKVLSSKGTKYKDNLDEEEYRKMLLQVFNECKRVLKDDGSIWINIKNRYKNGVVQTPSWIENYFTDMFLKNVVIWNFDWGGSTNTRLAPRYEYVYWYTKDLNKYKFNLDDIRLTGSGRNPTDVWYFDRINNMIKKKNNLSHPTIYPIDMIERIIKMSSDEGDTIFDPFLGSGTSVIAAAKLNRKGIGFELDQKYEQEIKSRIKNEIKMGL